jgi:hypothetical protein
MDATEGYRIYSPDHLDSSFIISNTKPRELLIMTIDLGEGLKDKIVVYEEDEPRTVARQFCLRHGLGPQIQQALLSSIIENLEFEETQPNSLHESLDGNRTKKYSTPQLESGRSDSKDKKFTSTIKRRLNFNEDRTFTPKKFESPKKIVRGRPALKPNDRMNRSSSRTNCKTKPRNELNESTTYNNASPTRVNQSCNIGQRLYYKGIKKKEVQDRRMENMRKEKTEKELSGITFKPMLASSSLVHVKRPDEPLENFLIKKAAEKQRALQAKREEKLRSELKGCTFAPVVDKNSAKLANKLAKNQSPDRFVKLYKEAGARQERNHKRAEQL